MSMTLGELKGQMREIVHQLNNMSSKMDAISHEISKNSGIPEEVEKLKLRVAALEEKESKREGAMGLGVWIMRSTLRSEERRVGKDSVSTSRSRWSPSQKKNKQDSITVMRLECQNTETK